jgi:hypothetical protein
MEIAEEILADRGLSNAHVTAPDGERLSVFWIVRPSKLVVAHDTLYRLHVNELCDRLSAGVDLEPATQPEVIRAILQVTEVAPLNRTGMLTILRAVQGTEFAAYFAGTSAHEKHPGEQGEVYSEAARALGKSIGRLSKP